MAIEIREVVIKASVTKTIGSGKSEYVTRSELQKIHEKLVARLTNRIKDLVEEQRSLR